MTKLFDEEKRLHDKILDEWYDTMKEFRQRMDDIFSEKAKLYDRDSPVWDRIEWPAGFVHEINKKANRVKQLYTGDDINWAEVNEELADIANYCTMLAAINAMIRRRKQ